MVFLNQGQLVIADNGVLRLGDAYDEHDLIVSTDNVFDSLFGLGVDNTALLIILFGGLVRVCLAQTFHDIIIR